MTKVLKIYKMKRPNIWTTNAKEMATATTIAKECIINKERKQRQLKLNLSDERKMRSFPSLFFFRPFFWRFSLTDSNSNTSNSNFSVVWREKLYTFAGWYTQWKWLCFSTQISFCFHPFTNPTVSFSLPIFSRMVCGCSCCCCCCCFWFIGTFILVFIAFHNFAIRTGRRHGFVMSWAGNSQYFDDWNNNFNDRYCLGIQKHTHTHTYNRGKHLRNWLDKFRLDAFHSLMVGNQQTTANLFRTYTFYALQSFLFTVLCHLCIVRYRTGLTSLSILTTKMDIDMDMGHD